MINRTHFSISAIHRRILRAYRSVEGSGSAGTVMDPVGDGGSPGFGESSGEIAGCQDGTPSGGGVGSGPSLDSGTVVSTRGVASLGPESPTVDEGSPVSETGVVSAQGQSSQHPRGPQRDSDDVLS